MLPLQFWGPVWGSVDSQCCRSIEGVCVCVCVCVREREREREREPEYKRVLSLREYVYCMHMCVHSLECLCKSVVHALKTELCVSMHMCVYPHACVYVLACVCESMHT